MTAVTTWISHLRLAENLLDYIGGLDPEPFYYGSLAPDSGLPNEDWSQYDPPKTVTHFLSAGEGEGRIRDLEFYRGYIECCANTLSATEYSFRFGYFFHLICDNLWAKRVWKIFKTAYNTELAEDKNFIWQIKKDWYGLDHKYLRDHPACPFWDTLITSRNPYASLPFLPQRALHHQLNYIKDFYTNHRPDDLDRPYPFFGEAAMDRFVADCTAAITKIYDVLVTRPSLTDSVTSLAWLALEEKAAYSEPVGEIQPES